jgi:hypothetical protein
MYDKSHTEALMRFDKERTDAIYKKKHQKLIEIYVDKRRSVYCLNLNRYVDYTITKIESINTTFQVHVFLHLTRHNFNGVVRDEMRHRISEEMTKYFYVPYIFFRVNYYG